MSDSSDGFADDLMLFMSDSQEIGSVTNCELMICLSKVYVRDLSRYDLKDDCRGFVSDFCMIIWKCVKLF